MWGKTRFLLLLETWALAPNHAQQFAVITADDLLFSFISEIFILNEAALSFLKLQFVISKQGREKSIIQSIRTEVFILVKPFSDYIIIL